MVDQGTDYYPEGRNGLGADEGGDSSDDEFEPEKAS